MDRQGKLLRAFLSRDDSWTLWRNDLRRCGNIKNAIVAAEDRRFYSHCGVDIPAIFRAIILNLASGRVKSGASTLTMQLMRMSLDHHRRSWSNKLVETFRALQCEREMSKEDILCWYLNFAPFGSNIYGVEAASRIYFRKTPENLTPEEAALLAGLVQAPSNLLPYRYPEKAEKRRQVILNRMYHSSYIDYDRLISARSESIRCHRNRLPVAAPHFAALLAEKYPGQQVISTIDAGLQYHAAHLLKQAVSDAPSGGNGAVIIVSNRDNTVRAFVGSAGFGSVAAQVNHATVPRGPGSLLKPFIYLTAFERGLAVPATIMDDRAVAFAGYAPRNYDRQWHGPVSIRKALAFSYNVPAVAMLDKIGVDSFTESLERFGLRVPAAPERRYGLALALGGAEFSLLELVRAYSALARLGTMLPLRFVENAPTESPERIADKDAAFLICDILKDRSRLQGRSLWKNGDSPQTFAWKTGTSNNLRDAWTIAWNPDWTVGVMLTCAGSGRNASLVGIKNAAPTAAALIGLAAGNEHNWYRLPAQISRRPVCSRTGLLPCSACRNTTTDYFQVGFDHTVTCQCGSDQNPDSHPQLISPQSGIVYLDKITLRADGPENGEIFWFSGSRYLGRTAFGDTLSCRLSSGTHKITCSDSKGSWSQTVSIRVR
jgi:penicillin-binding protein 1C